MIQKLWSTERVLKTPEAVFYNEQTNRKLVLHVWL
jgi:hypothetical protein